MHREVWFDGRNLDSDKNNILELIYNLNYEYLIIKRQMYEEIAFPNRIRPVIEVESENDLNGLAQGMTIITQDENIVALAKNTGFITSFYKFIDSEESMNSAWRTGENSDFLVVELGAETNIPLELLIAKLQNKKRILLKLVKTCQDAEIAYGVMEVGSDGVVLKTDCVDEIIKLNELMEKQEMGKKKLTKGTVINVEHIGMGYRACIDTTSLMKENEGMIVGSTSKGGLLLSSETHYLPYMELRPFRVNAGAVHSYMWSENEMTSYITELKAGSRLLCLDTNGNTRIVSVGRVKIEKRPLLKIEVEANGVRINSIIQDDWHIRLFNGNGEPVNASSVKEGDELLSFFCDGGRHVGIKIDEELYEK